MQTITPTNKPTNQQTNKQIDHFKIETKSFAFELKITSPDHTFWLCSGNQDPITSGVAIIASSLISIYDYCYIYFRGLLNKINTITKIS